MDLSSSKSACFEAVRPGEHDGVIVIFVSRILKGINEKTLPGKTIIFPLMTSGAKTIDLRSNLIKKTLPGHEEGSPMLLRILLCYYAFGDNSDYLHDFCLQKIVFF